MSAGSFVFSVFVCACTIATRSSAYIQHSCVICNLLFLATLDLYPPDFKPRTGSNSVMTGFTRGPHSLVLSVATINKPLICLLYSALLRLHLNTQSAVCFCVGASIYRTRCDTADLFGLAKNLVVYTLGAVQVGDMAVCVAKQA